MDPCSEKVEIIALNIIGYPSAKTVGKISFYLMNKRYSVHTLL